MMLKIARNSAPLCLRNTDAQDALNKARALTYLLKKIVFETDVLEEDDNDLRTGVAQVMDLLDTHLCIASGALPFPYVTDEAGAALLQDLTEEEL